MTISIPHQKHQLDRQEVAIFMAEVRGQPQILRHMVYREGKLAKQDAA